MFETFAATLLALAAFCVLEIIRVFVAVRLELRRIRRVRRKLIVGPAGGAEVSSRTSLLLRRQGQASNTPVGVLRRLEGAVNEFVEGVYWPLGVSALVAMICAASVAAGLLVGYLEMGPVMTLLGAAGGAFFPIVVLVSRARKIAKQIEAQLPDALDMMARATQVGHSIGQSIAQVADEMADPVSKELRITANEIALSNDAPRAFRGFAARVNSNDARFLALAVAVQDETGGSLVQTFRRLGSLMRQRAKLRIRIEAIVAGPRFTVRALLIFPVLAFSILWFNNPALLAPLWEEEQGQRLAMMSIIGIATGVVAARYLSRVRT